MHALRVQLNLSPDVQVTADGDRLAQVFGNLLRNTLRCTEASAAIIMVTARVEEIDRLLGLELGADDYTNRRRSHGEQPHQDAAQEDRRSSVRRELICSVCGVGYKLE